MKLTPLSFARRMRNESGREWYLDARTSRGQLGVPSYGNARYCTAGNLFILHRHSDTKEWYAMQSTSLEQEHLVLAQAFFTSGLQGARFRRRSDLITALETFVNSVEEE